MCICGRTTCLYTARAEAVLEERPTPPFRRAVATGEVTVGLVLTSLRAVSGTLRRGEFLGTQGS
jgi:hypothetical protein